MNGHKLSGNSGGTATALFYLLDNAKLIITDNSSEKNGTIEYSPWGINSNIVLLTSGNSSNEGYPKLEINAGNYFMGSSSENPCSLIRLNTNKTGKNPTATITGGTFTMQSSASDCITANAGIINIQNANFNSYGTCIYVYSQRSDITLAISGSEFTHRKHGISIGTNSTYNVTTNISGSKFTHQRLGDDGYAIV